MNKDNIFRSSNFYMNEGDVLHILIKDEVGDTVNFILNSVNSSGVSNETSVPEKPTIDVATGITDSSFTANWFFNENSTGYYLDVAIDSGFVTMVVGYDNIDVGNVNSYDVVGVDPVVTYYYRIRAYNDIGTSVNSDTESLTTDSMVADDWFLPSRYEFAEVYTNVISGGLGGFDITKNYWTSCETLAPATQAFAMFAGNGAMGVALKTEVFKVRAVRSFTSLAGTYTLGGSGQAGGWIFYINGTTYYEVAPSDCADSAWSNITALAVGTTSYNIGEGQNNTNEIMAQAGHVTSAAKLCDDLIV